MKAHQFVFQLLLVLLIVGTNVLAFGVLSRLWLVHQVVDKALSSRDLKAQFTITQFDQSGMEVTDFALSKGLRAKRIRVQWTPHDLLDHKLGPILIFEANVRAQQADGNWQIGGLDLDPFTSGETGSQPWQLDRITIKNSKIHILSPMGKTSAIADIKREPNGAITFKIRNVEGQTNIGDHLTQWQQGAVQGRLHNNQVSFQSQAQMNISNPNSTGLNTSSEEVRLDGNWTLTKEGSVSGNSTFDARIGAFSKDTIIARSARLQGAVSGTFSTQNVLKGSKLHGFFKTRITGLDLQSAEPLKLMDKLDFAEDLKGFAAALQDTINIGLSDMDVTAQTEFTFQNNTVHLVDSQTMVPKIEVNGHNIAGLFLANTAKMNLQNGAITLAGAANLEIDHFANASFSGFLWEQGPTTDKASVRKITTEKFTLSAKDGLRKVSLYARHIKVRQAGDILDAQTDVQAKWEGPLGGLQVTEGQFAGQITAKLKPGQTGIFLRDHVTHISATRIQSGKWAGTNVALILAPLDEPVLALGLTDTRLALAVREVKANIIKSTLDDFSALVGGQSGEVRMQFPKNEPAVSTAKFQGFTIDLGGEDPKHLVFSEAQISANRSNGIWKGKGQVSSAGLKSDLLPVHVVSGHPAFSFALDQNRFVLDALDVTINLAPVADAEYIPPLSITMDIHIKEDTISGLGHSMLSQTGQKLGTVSFRHDLKTTTGTFLAKNLQLGFETDGLQPQQLIPSMTGLAANVKGRVEYVFTGQWDAQGLTATQGNIDLAGLDLDLLLGRLEGISGNIEFSSLLPLRTGKPATITLDVFDPGVILNDGQLVFTLDRDGYISIQQARWPFAGGEIRVKPMEWEIGGTDQRALLVLDDIDLLEISGIVGFDGLSVEGKMSGQVPVHIAENTMFVEQAKLTAIPPGVLRYTGTIGDNASMAAPQAKMAFDLLKNLHFKQLELSLDGDVGGRMEAGLVIEGYNPDVVYGVPFLLRVNTSAEFTRLARQATEGLRMANKISQIVEIQQKENDNK